MSTAASKYRPGTDPSGTPIIVKVLPDPVYPQAKQVVLAPSKEHLTSGQTHSVQILKAVREIITYLLVAGVEVEAVIKREFMFLHVLCKIDLLPRFKFIKQSKQRAYLISYTTKLWCDLIIKLSESDLRSSFFVKGRFLTTTLMRGVASKSIFDC